jgi:hypothetical protein
MVDGESHSYIGMSERTTLEFINPNRVKANIRPFTHYKDQLSEMLKVCTHAKCTIIFVPKG